jgi:hypothetical protein
MKRLMQKGLGLGLPIWGLHDLGQLLKRLARLGRHEERHPGRIRRIGRLGCRWGTDHGRGIRWAGCADRLFWMPLGEYLS